MGNPTTFKGAAQTFNAANQNTQNATLGFDGDGNPQGYQGTPLTWDANNKLAAFGNVLTAGYGADGLRAWKQTASGRTYFLYDGLVPVCELDSNGSVTAVNTWGANGLLSRHVNGTGGGSVFYGFNPQGSVSVRLDSGGSILSSHVSDAWGAQVSSGSGYATDPYAGYGGQWGYYRDQESGLHLLGHRYYDAASGRFLNRDPIGYAGGVNLYAYCGSSPTAYIDPSGLYPHGNPFEDGCVINESSNSVTVCFDDQSGHVCVMLVPPSHQTSPYINIDFINTGGGWIHIIPRIPHTPIPLPDARCDDSGCFAIYHPFENRDSDDHGCPVAMGGHEDGPNPRPRVYIPPGSAIDGGLVTPIPPYHASGPDLYGWGGHAPGTFHPNPDSPETGVYD